MRVLLFLCFFFGNYSVFAQNNLENHFIAIESKVIEWRHHFHQNLELSNRDFKIDDNGLLLGVKTMTDLALDYLNQ
ncbi:hypothetical protein [Psychroserpens sp. SPM9]|uniref:hypothetical protein n=1 Tax=Psychroserpens sp. SPM9 TaxID=2975598 RepID=UPI0021A5EE62|nr:hypothetical protein [Psychroserpens sp. SPM9]MDG5491247.1 hypothetical protein [Psychroserpens sp. SPM9]